MDKEIRRADEEICTTSQTGEKCTMYQEKLTNVSRMSLGGNTQNLAPPGKKIDGFIWICKGSVLCFLTLYTLYQSPD